MSEEKLKSLWVLFGDFFGKSIFHPQYFTVKASYQGVALAKRYAKGSLLDVGCGRMPYRSEIEPLVTRYIGLDHPSVSKKYIGKWKPDIFADVTAIPLKKDSIDTVLLLQVLEHLPAPLEAFKEIRRVMKKGGIIIGALPFLYPIHDSPYDMARYTSFMLQNMLEKTGFRVMHVRGEGSFVGFWIQSMNVFLMTRIKDVLRSKKTLFSVLYLLLLIIVTPFCIISLNVLGWILLKVGMILPSYENYFPIDFVFVAKKA